MTDILPPRVHDATVRAEWVDYNGHMNVAYYMLVFDHATDAFLERLGIGTALRQRTGSSVFAAEAHIIYEHEVVLDERVYVTCQILDHDAKRLHLFLRMHRAVDDLPVAAMETMILHVDLTDRRVGPFPEAVRLRTAAEAEKHLLLDKPAGVSRIIGIRR